MLRHAPSAPIWPGIGAKVQTRDMVSDPATEMPTNLKLRSTDFRRGPYGSSDMAGRIHQFADQRQALDAQNLLMVALRRYSCLSLPKRGSRLISSFVFGILHLRRCM